MGTSEMKSFKETRYVKKEKRFFLKQSQLSGMKIMKA